MNPFASKEFQETHVLFPSGEWEGFYTYFFGPDADRHYMYFNLDFKNKEVSGRGSDSVGTFTWRGSYDTESLRCTMLKLYMGAHSVFYDGRVDENGIWGTWTIEGYFKGGFHIWPKKQDENKSAVFMEVKTISITRKI
jgi:hypothetical protein